MTSKVLSCIFVATVLPGQPVSAAGYDFTLRPNCKLSDQTNYVGTLVHAFVASPFSATFVHRARVPRASIHCIDTWSRQNLSIQGIQLTPIFNEILKQGRPIDKISGKGFIVIVTSEPIKVFGIPVSRNNKITVIKP